MDRREIRRKRRHRNQVIAYIVLFLFMTFLAAGIVLGVKMYTERQKQSDTQTNQSQVEELFQSEEPLVIVEQSTEVTEPELTPEEKLDEIVDAAIEVMPLEDKVAGLFMVRPESITGVSTAVKAGDGTREALAKHAVGGIVYFAKNIQSAEQLKEMISNTRSYSKYPLFIGIDEEGGSVSRLADKSLVDRVDSAQAISQTLDASNAYQAGTTIGTYMAEYGFDLDFAPVADLTNISKSIMTKRSFGSDAASAIPFVTSMMQGLEEQGITACVKHFPGIGSTVQDTHDGLAVSNRTAEEFRAEEFTVFKAAIDEGANMIMVGHMAAPSLVGDNTPSSMSSVIVTDILREELGFEGVIITDAMDMSAISEYYESDHAAIMALKAGCDMILMPDDYQVAYSGVLQAVKDGVISEERVNDSLRRIYRIKLADKVE
ncbi:MAG: beta-N-acetylhexosaminidase [Lachnospiraceae bacterium]|nr:beta-N-acetylhexosaminidase [Lachnospiraceae bacterium]